MHGIHQELLEAVDADGTKVKFVVLDDDRCAVVRDGQFVYIGNGDQEGVEQGIFAFNSLTKSRLTGERGSILRAS